MKINKKITLGLLSTLLLTGCSNNWQSTNTPEKNTSPIIDNSPTSTSSISEKTLTSETENNGLLSKLNINHNCIGCRKCLRIAPNNFAFDQQKNIAVPQGSEINYQKVTQAIKACPVQAIELG